jgi:hypothetical protein
MKPRSQWAVILLGSILAWSSVALAQDVPKPVLSVGFDEGEGTRCEDRAGQVPGAIAQGEVGPLWAQGPRGGALWFFGRPDECVSIPARPDLDLTTELTIAAWVWPAQLGSFQTIAWKGDRHGLINRVNYRLSIRPEGRLEFTFKGAANEWYQIGDSQPLPTGKWTHVAATYQRGLVKLYVNGQVVDQGRIRCDLPGKDAWHGDRMLANDSPLEIGRGQDVRGEPAQCFHGAIDELSLWPTALTTLPAVGSPPESSPLGPLLAWEKELDSRALVATPYLTGRVQGDRPWVLTVDFPGAKDRGVLSLRGKADAGGRFCYLLNDLGGIVDLRGAPCVRVRAYRRSPRDPVTIHDAALDAGSPKARVVVDPSKPLQVIRNFGSYADVPTTFLPEAAQRDAQYGPLLAELKEVGLAHLDFGVIPQAFEPENDDSDPQHINWAYFRKQFASNAWMQTLVKYLHYLESQGFTVGLRAQGYPNWLWIKGPGAVRKPNCDEVAEYSVALMKLMRDEGIHLTHFVPVWEPTYEPEIVAMICARTASLARQHGVDTPVVGPYVNSTGGQTADMDAMPHRYTTGKRYVAAYLKIAGDLCDAIGVEDYASGDSLIEPNLKRLWREVIEPCSKSGRAKELWMLEYGAPCGPGPWNFYPSRWHGTYATYDSAFRLARCLHQQFNGGVSRFFFWKAYDVVGDGKPISCCGLIKASLHDCERRPPFYTARMFWKHIPCGSRHVECASDADILANAFVKDGRFTVVLTNPRPGSVKTDVRLAGQSLAPAASLYSSTEEIKYQEREVAARGDTIASLVLPPRSVNTVVCRAARIDAPFNRTVWDDAPPGAVYLSDLPWAAVSQTGTSGLLRSEIDGKGVNVARDANSLQQWIVTSGVRYRKGLGTRAPSEVRYDLNGRYATFEAVVGLDDADAALKGHPAAVFEVFVDGKKSFSSGPVTPGQKAQAVRVPCSQAKELRLVVAVTGDAKASVMADWADAKLIAIPHEGSK